jgi:hypothetical protein
MVQQQGESEVLSMNERVKEREREINKVIKRYVRLQQPKQSLFENNSQEV